MIHQAPSLNAFLHEVERNDFGAELFGFAHLKRQRRHKRLKGERDARH